MQYNYAHARLLINVFYIVNLFIYSFIYFRIPLFYNFYPLSFIPASSHCTF